MICESCQQALPAPTPARCPRCLSLVAGYRHEFDEACGCEPCGVERNRRRSLVASLDRELRAVLEHVHLAHHPGAFRVSGVFADVATGAPELAVLLPERIAAIAARLYRVLYLGEPA